MERWTAGPAAMGPVERLALSSTCLPNRVTAVCEWPAKWGQHPVPPRIDLFTEQNISLENAGEEDKKWRAWGDSHPPF